MPKDGELFRVFTLFEPEKCFRWKAFILSKQINSCPFRGSSVKLDGLLDAGIWKLLKNLKPKCLCLLVDTSTGSTSVLGKHKAWLWLKVWATELTTKVFDEVHPDEYTSLNRMHSPARRCPYWGCYSARTAAKMHSERLLFSENSQFQGMKYQATSGSRIVLALNASLLTNFKESQF